MVSQKRNIKKISKYLGAVLLGLILVVAMLYGELIAYGIKQAQGQLSIMINAKPVEEYLNDPAYPDSLKQKLQLIDEVRSFAISQLGIEKSDNYTKMYDQQGEELMWVVTASAPYQLEAYKWHFPILGSMSYKGFFEPQLAEQLREELSHQGYDTNIRNAGGWSTLGVLNDPILSNMLYRTDGQLAELIIHELTHGTIFVRDSIKFNENLATFIGMEGAKLFLKNAYQGDTLEYDRYVSSIELKRKYSRHMIRGAQLLDSVYNTNLVQNLTIYEKDSIKRLTIANIMGSLDSIENVRSSKRWKQLDVNTINNTFFLSYLRYRGYYDELQAEYVNKYQEDLEAMVNDYKKKHRSIF